MTNANGEIMDGGTPAPVPHSMQDLDDLAWPVDEGPVPDAFPDDQAPDWSADDSARMILLASAVLLFAGTIMIGFLFLPFVTETTWDRVERLLSTIIPVETLILGAAVSYYFKTAPPSE